jgi:hypothetical protein
LWTYFHGAFNTMSFRVLGWGLATMPIHLPATSWPKHVNAKSFEDVFHSVAATGVDIYGDAAKTIANSRSR